MAQMAAVKDKPEPEDQEEPGTASQSHEMPEEFNENIARPSQPTQNVESVKPPLLYVDVNLGPQQTERIVVYEGDTAPELAKDFAERHSLNPAMIGKLTELLEAQMNSLLECIAEEEGTTSGVDE